eukprot:scaffold69417_cov66-Phaeocystis_antarctica.AAC.2
MASRRVLAALRQSSRGVPYALSHQLIILVARPRGEAGVRLRDLAIFLLPASNPQTQRCTAYKAFALLRHKSASLENSVLYAGASYSTADRSKLVAASLSSAAERSPTSQEP